MWFAPDSRSRSWHYRLAVSTWWKQVIASAPANTRASLADAALTQRVERELAAARARWPEASITDAQLATALASRLGAQRDLGAALSRLRVEDLFLAQWCTTGDARAIAAFEQVHKSDLDGVLARFRRLPVTSDELLQTLRIKLFVATADRPPRIGDYSGFGFLQNWLRVTALRALVDIARSERARKIEELMADDDLLGVPELGPDVASKYSRDQISKAIKQAFARAVAGLAPRQRNFLRHAQVDLLTLDQIAALYSIHRATVARTLAQARTELSENMRKELGLILGVADDAVGSIVGAADSRLDLSLSRVLKSPDLADGSESEDG
ncbi:MAG: putative DNA-binding regulatory protein [Myxococcales bacterium]|nr:putative DNA-binding regulatory protein [Myxococcales bacterium]